MTAISVLSSTSTPCIEWRVPASKTIALRGSRIWGSRCVRPFFMEESCPHFFLSFQLSIFAKLRRSEKLQQFNWGAVHIIKSGRKPCLVQNPVQKAVRDIWCFVSVVDLRSAMEVFFQLRGRLSRFKTRVFRGSGNIWPLVWKTTCRQLAHIHFSFRSVSVQGFVPNQIFAHFPWYEPRLNWTVAIFKST